MNQYKNILLKTFLAVTLLMISAATAMASTRAYGIRVYDSVTGVQSKVVSFDVTSPGKIKVEYDLGDEAVRAAAYHDGKLYMLVASELVCDALKTIDLTTGEITTVKVYDLWIDKASSLIPFDMTFDATTGKFYFLAIDFLENESVDDDFTLGLYTLDPSTGEAQLVGGQNAISLVALAADNDGYLYAIDDCGNLWDVNKSNGRLGDILEAIPGDYNSGLQSATFDSKTNTMYWASFEGEGNSQLRAFHFGDEMIDTQDLGLLADHSEVIGLHIDPMAVSTTAPDAPANLLATPAAGGALQATLSWTNPTTDIDAAPIVGKIDVRVMRDGATIATLTDCIPGSAATYTDTAAPEGSHVYSVQAVSAMGEGRISKAASIFVGEDVPGAVAGAKAIRTGNAYDILLTWDIPTAGKSNGWYDTTTLVYTITRQPDGVEVAHNIAATTFTDQTITATAGYSYEITASNAKGTGSMAETNIVPSGAPLVLPYSCNFSDATDFRLWTIIDGDGDGETWYRENNYAGTDDWFLKYMSNVLLGPSETTDDWFISAPIHLEAGHFYNLEYAIRLMSSNGLFPCNYSITIGRGNTIEAQTQVLSAIDGEENMVEFTHHDVAVSVAETGDYNIGFQLRNRVPTQITDIALTEVLADDIAVTDLDGPFLPIAGQENELTVKVANTGGNDIDHYTLTLCDEAGNTLATRTVDTPLASSASVISTITWTPTTVGDTQLVCRVETASDANAANNITAPFAVTVLPEGSWRRIGTETNVTTDVPFSTYAAYSASTTVYGADEIQIQPGQTINGIEYYFTTLAGAKELMMPASIYCNDELVFDGAIHMVPTRGKVEIAFDKPVVIDGNDITLTIVSNYGSAPLGYMFYITKVSEALGAFCYHGDAPFDFTQDMTNAKSRANISLFVAGADDTAVRTLSAGTADQRIYRLDGTTCGTTGINHLPAGIYVIGSKKIVKK